MGFRLSGPFDVLVNLRAFSRRASSFVDGWLRRLLARRRSSLPLDVRRSLSGRKVVPESAYGRQPAPDVECVAAVSATSLGAGCLRLRMVWRRGIASRGERAEGVVVETWVGMRSDSRAENARPEYDAAVHDDCLCRTLNLAVFFGGFRLSLPLLRQ